MTKGANIQGIGKVESQTQSGVRSWVSKRTASTRRKPEEQRENLISNEDGFLLYGGVKTCGDCYHYSSVMTGPAVEGVKTDQVTSPRLQNLTTINNCKIITSCR